MFGASEVKLYDHNNENNNKNNNNRGITIVIMKIIIRKIVTIIADYKIHHQYIDYTTTY